jgi:protease-4
MRFLSNVLATLVGIFLFFMIAFFGLIFIAALFGGNEETVVIKENSVIELDLSKVELDYAGKINFTDIGQFTAHHDGLVDITNAIEYAKSDNNIKGISLKNVNSQLGIAQTKALRDQLEDFKKSGKFIYAYAEEYSQKEYYLASVADQIYINPVGALEFKGLGAEIMFFKGIQEKTGVKMEVIRHGKYKSAVEPFLEDKMSTANREQTSQLLQSIWDALLVDISKSRKISVAQLNTIADNLGARTPELAKATRLVDGITYEDHYDDIIRKALKVEKDEDYNTVAIVDYAKDKATASIDLEASDKIAIIYAQGEIAAGEGDVNVIGDGAMRRAIREARRDEEVKAIVLRIDSPGGNALTSDLIWREIELTKKIKPVVVSMGNYAASGGYYIACNAHKIFAEKTTITGSIGVFGVIPNLTALGQKIGLTVDQVQTNPNAQDYSVFKPMDPNFQATAQEGVERVYATFIKRVADGRKLTTEQVDAIGQGRVWSGSDALKIGLVDKIGGLEAAIAEAAKLGKTKKYRIQDYPEYEREVLAFFEDMGLIQSKSALLKEQLGEQNYALLQRIQVISQQQGVMTRIPYEMKID